MSLPNSQKNAKHIILILLFILAIYALFKFVIKPLKEKQLEEGNSNIEVKK